MRTFASAEDLRGAVGEELGVGAWITVDQARIDAFAEATGDQQWIHVDPERAARDSPYGATVAHGYLTLALVPAFIASARALPGARLSLNYGLNRVRFPAPVIVGARLRGRVALAGAERVEGGLRVVYAVTAEIEGGTKPALVVEAVVVHLW